MIAIDYEKTLTAHVEDLTATVARLSSEFADLSVAAQPLDAMQALGVPKYETVDAWVAEYFCPVFARPIGGEIRWCTQWMDHTEALSRLESLWRSWEVLRRDPGTGMAIWFSSFLDPQLPVLLARTGTFAQCSPNRHVCTPPFDV